ncbi:MAG: hypothetical protein ABII27_04590 [bacterium]
MPNLDTTPVVKMNTEWTIIEVIGGPEIILTVKGYTPVLLVKVGKSDSINKLYIAPKSLAEKLEPLRKNNEDKFVGLKIRIRKESLEKFSKYELEKID